MDEVTKGLLGNELISHSLITYLIKTGVIDEVGYVEHVEVVKYAAMQRAENTINEDQNAYKDFIRGALDEHIANIKDKE